LSLFTFRSRSMPDTRRDRPVVTHSLMSGGACVPHTADPLTGPQQHATSCARVLYRDGSLSTSASFDEGRDGGQSDWLVWTVVRVPGSTCGLTVLRLPSFLRGVTSEFPFDKDTRLCCRRIDVTRRVTDRREREGGEYCF